MAVDVNPTVPTNKAGDAGASDAAIEPGVSNAETSNAETSNAETSNAETSNADLSTPEASNADWSTPDASRPEASSADASRPDASSADARARRSRRRKSSRRTALSRLRDAWQGRAPLVLSILLAVAVAGSLLAVGTVHVSTLLFIAPLCVLIGAFALVVEDTPTRLRSLPALILVGLGVYSGLQSMALPASTLRRLSPVAARVWSDAFRLLGESSSRWASVSVDPSASRVEALKWLCYAAVFFGAAKLGREKGSQPGTLIVFGSAVLGGILSVVHGLFGIEEWLGLYRPQMTGPVWALAPLLNPNNFAGYLNLALFAGMGLLFAHQPLLPRWATGLSIVVLAALVVLSGSRGGVLALVSGFAASGIAFRSQQIEAKRRGGVTLPAWIPLVSVAVAGVALAVIGATPFVWQQLLDETTGKLRMLEYSQPVVRDHLWTGIGRGCFETAFAAYRQDPGHVIYQYAENFVVQWLVEWGLPVAVLGFAGLAWSFAPQRWGIGRRAVSTGIALGIGVLLIHNLVDLATEVASVGIALSVLLGTAVGAVEYHAEREGTLGTEPHAEERLRSRNDDAMHGAAPPEPPRAAQTERRRPRRSRAPRRFVAGSVALLVGLLLVLGVAVTSSRDALTERRELAERLQAVFGKPLTEPAVMAIRSRVKQALLRHPADPYLPLAGALLTPDEGSARLVWLSHAIRRDPLNARPHLMIAETLASHGFIPQALLELRRTLELEPALTGTVAQRVARLTANPDEIARAVPPGARGIPVLNALALQYAGTPEKRRIRDDLLAESVRRNPNDPSVNTILAGDLLNALNTGAEFCNGDKRSECEKQLERHLELVERAGKDNLSHELEAVLLKARLMAYRREYDRAERWLAEVCQRFQGPTCQGERVTLAAKLDERTRFEDAATAYASAACSTAEACSNAHLHLGGLELQRRNPHGALSHFERAASEHPSAAAWLRVAELALQLGRIPRAETALAAAKRHGAVELAEPLEKRLLEAQRNELLKTLGTR